MRRSSIHLKTFLIVAVVFSFLQMKGQNSDGIKSILSPSEKKKYEKADDLIFRGDLLVEIQDSAVQQRNSSKQVKREINLKKEQANIILNDGYKIKLKVLRDYCFRYMKENAGLSEATRQEVNGILSNLDEGMRKSGKLYSASRKTPRLDKTIMRQEEAQKIQAETVEETETALLRLHNKMTVEKPAETVPEKPAEPVVAEPVKEPVTAEEGPDKIETVAVESVETKEKAAEPVKPVKLYFSIQVLAKKKRATVQDEKMVYSGSRKVMENRGDGWYRYSVGKFDSYAEAHKVKKEEGIDGFIVVYKGDRRITMSQAKKLLGGFKK